MTTIQLTTTQTQVLQHALDHNDGRIDWFPESVKGGARQKVLQGLFNRALITTDGTTWFVAAEGFDAMGYARPTVCMVAQDDHELEATVAQVEANWTKDAVADQPAPSESGDSQGVSVETDPQADQCEIATGCDDCLSCTDVPESQIDATQGQPVSATTPDEQPLVKAIRTREHSKQATIIGMLQRAEGATIAQICEATGWQAHTVRGTFAGAFKKKLGMTITSDKTQGGVRTYRAAA